MANQHLVERNHDIVAYPSWAELPAVTMREWAIFFGQNITASEMVVPPLSITGEFPEHVPDGIPASFHAEGRFALTSVIGSAADDIIASASIQTSSIFLGYPLTHHVGPL